MTKIGVLVHVYHLGTDNWEELVWGNPQTDELGTLTTFADQMLTLPFDMTIVPIIYSGPSGKAGLSEGGYARRYLLDRIDHLADFPRLRQKIETLSAADYQTFIQRLHDLYEGPVIKNTSDEIAYGAEYFKKQGAHHVIQIAASTHAPRCIKNQAIARHKGAIDPDQQWYMVTSDTRHIAGPIEDIVIIEPPSRGDDPLKNIHPTLSEVVRPYYDLSTEGKKRFAREVKNSMNKLNSYKA